MRNIESNKQLDFQHFSKLLYRMLAVAHSVLQIKRRLQRTSYCWSWEMYCRQ